MYLYSLAFAQFLELLTCPWHVGNHYGNVPFVGVVVLLIVVVAGLVWVIELIVPLVECPIWELALL